MRPVHTCLHRQINGCWNGSVGSDVFLAFEHDSYENSDVLKHFCPYGRDMRVSPQIPRVTEVLLYCVSRLKEPAKGHNQTDWIGHYVALTRTIPTGELSL